MSASVAHDTKKDKQEVSVACAQQTGDVSGSSRSADATPSPPETEVMLGFVEKVYGPSRQLAFSPHMMPSKVGGKPVWLEPRKLPASKLLACPHCSFPMPLLLQIYAPLPLENCYHRTIYIFCCKSGDCHERDYCFQVFRAQLPRENEYYALEQPQFHIDNELLSRADDEESEEKRQIELFLSSLPPNPSTNATCCVCGLYAANRCARCKRMQYCSKEHQVADWQAGHKQLCHAQSIDTLQQAPNAVQLIGLKKRRKALLFAEHDIITEPESTQDSTDVTQENDQLLAKLKASSSVPRSTIEKLEREVYENNEKDSVFSKFQKTVSRAPDQILRYSQTPSWISSTVPEPSAVSNCQLCGSQRVFEFQIMPQLLYYLHVETKKRSDSTSALTWGTLAIYTCSQNCTPPAEASRYAQELLYRQLDS